MASSETEVEHLRKMFELLEKFLHMQEFDKDLKDELSEACPDYLTVLSTSKRDLLRSDCCIITTGESSAGKTSLVNLLIQRTKLFPPSNIANTGTICRIRNSETMMVKLFTKDDVLIQNVQTADVNELKSAIKKYTNINNEVKDVYYVDVYLPVKILQGNVIIVDTPGIGEKEDLDKMLLNFLPHAVSFIFVINAGNAGGIQEDRILKILKTIMENRRKMPCFDPRDVMFLTNKWDIVESDSDDEDDKTNETGQDKTWTLIRNKLDNGWGSLEHNNLFRVSLKQVNQSKTNEFTEEYRRFEHVLLKTIERNANKRLKYYYSFFKSFTSTAERGTRARLQVLERSKHEQEKIVEENRKEIEALTKQCEEAKAKFVQYKNETISKLADGLHNYLNSSHGKQEILNPPGYCKISSVSYWSLKEEVCKRMERGIKRWCEGQEVVTIMKDAEATLRAYLLEIEYKIRIIEAFLTGFGLSLILTSASVGVVGLAGVGIAGITSIAGLASASFASITGLASAGLASFTAGIAGLQSMSLFMLPFTVTFQLTFGIVLSALLINWGLNLIKYYGTEGHERLVDYTYEICLRKIKLKECFENSFGKEYNNYLNQIFDETIPKKLDTLQKLNERLLKEYEQIRQKHKSLESLKGRMDTLQEETRIFEEKIKNVLSETD